MMKRRMAIHMSVGILVNKGFVNKCLLGQQRQWDRVDSDFWALPSFPHHTWPVIFANISGNRSILEKGPLSKFFRQVKGERGKVTFCVFWASIAFSSK